MATQAEMVEFVDGAQGTWFGRLRAARLTLSNALIVTRREVRDSFRDWRILGPIVILTLLFPSLAKFAAERFAGFVENYGAELIGERTLPFMLMIVGFFPISISLVIALETFVGEKERSSLEPLLATPLTNTELYIGKTLAAIIPPLLTSYGGMAVYLFGLLTGGQQWHPPVGLIIQIGLLTGMQALVMVTACVVISGQTTSVRAANLLASFVIIPMALLVQFESVIMFFAGYQWLTPILVGLLAIDVLLIRMGVHIFNREELLGRELDHINLRAAWRRFTGSVRGSAGTLWQWWRVEVLGAVRRLARPNKVVVFCLALAFVVAFLVPYMNPDRRIPLNARGDDLTDELLKYYNFLSGESNLVPMAVWQNGRVLLAALILSMFTFGVMGIILAMLPFGILGFFFAQFLINGVDPALFVAAVLPHSVVEVPAIVLMVGAALRLGVVFIDPPKGTTVGAAWMGALADVVKVSVGLVVPLLVVAALVEVYVTPALVRLFL